MIVNGKNMEFVEGLTVSKLLDKLNINKNKVVVEVDLNIVSKDEYDTFKIFSDSKVEIIRFVGGG